MRGVPGQTTMIFFVTYDFRVSRWSVYFERYLTFAEACCPLVESRTALQLGGVQPLLPT